uniref:Putative ribonuclease H-like domain-containing protein n=1 Tax=Tanacetum cinerariifolium TaxID=118510 RepID=A0A6L2MIS5_TANCI|nr:putative ribonuclease H-like domain-containing protein [Tanacetum cinerariifolium]
MLVVPVAGNGANAVAAGAAAAHDISPPPIVPPTHSTLGPSSAPQVTHVREPTLVRDPTPVRDPTHVRDPTPSPVRKPTPDSPRPHSPPPRNRGDPEMYMFALTVSIAEPKNIKEAMVDSAWMEAMQEELHQFDRLQV